MTGYDPRVRDLPDPIDWANLRVGVAGIGVAGLAAGAALAMRVASVIAFDGDDGSKVGARAQILRDLGCEVRLGDGTTLPGNLDLLVVSPGFNPDAPVVQAAIAAEVPIWGEMELAWRLAPLGRSAGAPWLVISGTNGKTTTTLMVESILRADSRRALAVGNIGHSVVDAVTEDVAYDAFAVEIGAQQLPFVHTLSPTASVVLNLADDHLDVFGSREEYDRVKGLTYERTQVACVYNVADPATERMVERADVIEGCRAIGFTLGIPAPSMMGVVEDMLVDRAFLAERKDSAIPVASVADVHPAAPHNVANALAAAALTRAIGVHPHAIARGLREFEPAGHRIATVAEVGGVRWIDDSKATNTHAALTSLRAYDPVVWIAGGLAKGQAFDDLVQQARSRLRGVVLLGREREAIARALAEHAPDVPVVEIATADLSVMTDVVTAAAAMAQPGDTVLLAPGCSSWDIFAGGYAQRGDAFAMAVLEHVQGGPSRD